MKTKATDLFKDQLIGEEIYFGKPEDRPLPKVGDRCFVMERDGELHIHEVVRVNPKTFDTKSMEVDGLHCMLIPHKRFRPEL